MSRRAGHFPINGRTYPTQDPETAAFRRLSSSRATPDAVETTAYQWTARSGDPDISDDDVRVIRRATSPVGSPDRDELFSDDLDDEPQSQPLPSALDYGIDDPYVALDDPVVAKYLHHANRPRSPAPAPRYDYGAPYSGSRRHSRNGPVKYSQQNPYEAGYPSSFETRTFEPRPRREERSRPMGRMRMAVPETISTARQAYFRREGSDPTGGPFSNEFRIVKPFTFVPRGLSRDGTASSTAASPGDVLSDSESPMHDDNGLLGTTDADDSAGPPDHATNVYRSLYTGDGYYDGAHSAELSLLADPIKGMRPLFRWLHVHQNLQDFDEFSAQISHLNGLVDSQRAAIADTLVYVRKHFVKSRQTSTGTTIRYMEPAVFQSPGHFPEGITVQSSDPRASSASHATTSDMAGRASRVVWLCLPYFYLDKYSGLGAGEGHNGSFPSLTLLQAQYSGHSRERDMMQAICRLGNVPQGWCYHIGQLWAMVVDDSVLITCGSMTEAALRGETVKLNPGLIRQPSFGSGMPLGPDGKTLAPGVAKIFVEYGSSFMWALPVEECGTWFAFIRHFREFWPLSTTFRYRSSPIRPAQWPKILRNACKPKATMILSLEVSQPPRPFTGGVLPKPLSDAKPNADPSIAIQLSPPAHRNGRDRAKAKKETVVEEFREPFHVFTWRTKCKASEVATDPGLRRMMEEEHEFLSGDSGSHDSRAYRNARVETREQVFRFLRRQEKFRSEITGYDTRVDLFNSADLVFQFFLPLQAGLPTCGQFWGSIMTFVQGQESPENIRFSDRNAADSNLGLAANRLEALAGTFHVFRWMMSYASDQDRALLSIPGPLSRAWLHVVMGLVHATIGGPSVPADDFWIQHFDVAYQYMLDGMRTILDSLAGKPLIAYATVRPMEVLAMMSLGLMDDVVGKYTNVSDTYETYLRALETNISARASPSHQYRINNVKSEIIMVRQTRMSQLGIFKCLRATYTGLQHQEWLPQRFDAVVGRSLYRTDQMPALPPMQRASGSRAELAEAMPPVPLESFNRISSTTYGGLKGLIFSDGSLTLERKVNDFEEFSGQARMLEQSNTARLDVTRDRQERATYAFTVVTIIFLPLSAVASVFGINTSDIRDMPEGQWLYWAVAVPVTVLVIIIGLWWMGELWALLDWCRRGLMLGKKGGWYGSADGGGVLLTGPMAAQSAAEADDGLRTRPQRRRTGYSDSSRWTQSTKTTKKKKKGKGREDVVVEEVGGPEVIADADDPSPLSDDADDEQDTIQEQVRREVVRVLERQRQEQIERRVLDALRVRQRQRRTAEEGQDRRFRIVVDDRMARPDGGERVPEGFRYWQRGRDDRGRDDRGRNRGSDDRERVRDQPWDRERNRDSDIERPHGSSRERRGATVDRGRNRDSDTERSRERRGSTADRPRGVSSSSHRGQGRGSSRGGGRGTFRPRIQTRIVERHTDEMENEGEGESEGPLIRSGRGEEGLSPRQMEEEGTQTTGGGEEEEHGGEGDMGRAQPSLA